MIILFSFVVINLSATQVSYNNTPPKSSIKINNINAIAINNSTQNNATKENNSILPVEIIPYNFLLIIFVAIASISIFLATFSREIRRDFMARTIAMFITIFILIFGLKAIIGNTNVVNTVSNSNPFLNFSSLVFLSVFIVITTLTGYSVILLIKELRSRYQNSFIQKSENMRNELIKRIQDLNVKYSSNASSNPKDFILHCYKSFCEFVESKGVSNPSYLTAREFEFHLKNLIGYESKYLHSLTNLFERAKYSIEEMNAKDAEYASYLLDSILVDLRNAK